MYSKHAIVNDEWLFHYQNLSRIDNNLVKVFSATTNSISMERLDVCSTLEEFLKTETYNKSFIFDIYKVINSSWIYCLEYSKTLESSTYFLNCDFKLDNIVVTSDRKLKIIDPDSYCIVTNMKHTEKYAMCHTHLLFLLQRSFAEGKIDNV